MRTRRVGPLPGRSLDPQVNVPARRRLHRAATTTKDLDPGALRARVDDLDFRTAALADEARAFLQRGRITQDRLDCHRVISGTGVAGRIRPTPQQTPRR